MDVALALAAAFFFALGLVLQEKAASEQPDETLGAGFLVRLVRQPIWLLGLAMQGSPGSSSSPGPRAPRHRRSWLPRRRLPSRP